MTPAPDPVAEVRDLMVQLLTETRAAARQQEEMRAEFRAHVARQRVIQRIALVGIILLLPVLAYFVSRL
jgi:hypothetical protein